MKNISKMKEIAASLFRISKFLSRAVFVIKVAIVYKRDEIVVNAREQGEE